MSRADYQIYRRIDGANWNSRQLDLEGLSCSETHSMEICIPGSVMPDGVPVVSTVRIENGEITGTPTQVGCRFFGRTSGYDNLTKYRIGKETWYLSDKLFILDGKVALIRLPTNSKTVIIGINLLISCSPMAKIIKEKVLPNLILYGQAEIKVVNTNNWRAVGTEVFTPIEEGTKGVLLRHLDELCT